MTEAPRPFAAGILDFNPKRMSGAEAASLGIPPELFDHMGDFRQYPANIAMHFPEGVSWFRAEQPWYFADVMANDGHVSRLMESDVLILSGSGLSAYKIAKNDMPPKYREALERSQEVIRDFLGQGKWVLGDCFGGQRAIQAVGGGIGRLPEGTTEAGWLSHALTRAGRDDEVFGKLPDVFWAPHFHNDYVEVLPAAGTKVQTTAGEIAVTRSEILAVRHGYLGKRWHSDTTQSFIMASVVEFDNGARLYQIQPHPEMATREKANFLVRMNDWLRKESEMGEEYYQNALQVPDDADFSVASVIPRFVEAARRHLEQTRGQTFIEAVMLQDLFRYLLK